MPIRKTKGGYKIDKVRASLRLRSPQPNAFGQSKQTKPHPRNQRRKGAAAIPKGDKP